MRSTNSSLLRAGVYLLFSALQCATVTAQTDFTLSAQTLESVSDLDFGSLNTRDTLPHQSIYGFTQDTRGFVWIATYGGLSRFDGSHLHTYTHDSKAPNSLPNNSVRALLPGQNGDLWIGTDNAGVAIYRASTDSFDALPNLPQALANARIYAMVSDGHGGIWAGGQFGLFHYDPATNAYEVFSVAGGHPGAAGFAFKHVFSLFLDRKGSLWVGGDAGLQVKRANTAKFVDVLGLEGENEVGLRPYVWSFLQDSSGRLWVGCDHVGLAIYDPTAHVLRGVPGLTGLKSQIGEHTVRGLFEHAPGQLWIATYGAGMITYDVKNGDIRSFMKGSGKPYPLKNNFLRGLFKDRSGVLWLASDNGVSTLNEASHGIYQIHPSLIDPDARSGTEIRSVGQAYGKVWIGFDQGEFGTLEKEARVKKVRPADSKTPGQSTSREILAIVGGEHREGQKTVYASGTGLFQVDLAKNTYRPVPDPSIAQEVVSAPSLDGENVWAGTYNGLYLYNSRTKQGHMYRHDPADPFSLPENDIRRVLHARDGRLWLSTRTGLDLRDPATGHFQAFRHTSRSDSLPGDNVWVMTEDHNNRLWVATTDAGLAVLWNWTPEGTPVFRTIDKHNGLPSDSVLTVALGKDGRIWANTASGLAVIDPETLAVQVFSVGEGLRSISQKLFGSVVLEDGTLLFLGAEGLIGVLPDRLEQRSYRGPLVMTSLQLQHDTRSSAVAAYEAASRNIHLHADYRGFEASFALLDYTAPESMRYFHKLVGIDKDWVPFAEGHDSVSYSDLPAGNYRLLIRAVSRSGQGPVIESSYQIEAPRLWTETLPFRMLLVLLACALFYLLVRIRTAVLERRRQQLEDEIRERTLELNEQKDKLQVANNLLNQLASRDSLTNLFNRRHFISLLDTELARSKRTTHTFSLLLLDIDYFKTVNDTYGHLAGDTVIQAVAERISRSLRATDTLARFGGEEYIVLLPNTAVPQGTALALRILAAISSTPIEIDGFRLNVSVSIGCAEADVKDTTTMLLERADRALYAAKRAGRNCLRVSGTFYNEPSTR
jgi:diguanylate cyclase (GGDEF)-like protein